MRAKWEQNISESLVEQFYNKQTEEEIDAGFNETLSFGTAGIRNTFGIGPGRLNKFTIQKFALGLVKYLKNLSINPRVIIHFDTRHLSKEFAIEIAKVLGTQNIPVTLPNTYKSTPELSFAVRHLNMTAGIMITASHNPKNYNGIKVYGSDGGQLLTKASLKLSSYIDTVKYPLNIQTEAFEVLKSKKLILPFKEETTQSYKSSIKNLVGYFTNAQSKTILTSLHGTSLPLLSQILKDLSYSNYVIEELQSKPDGDFPTLNVANPEMEDTFDLGKQLAEKEDAQLIIATDPDADRLGIVERYEDGSTRYFNGNEIGLLLIKLRNLQLSDTQHKYIIKSVVTGALSEKLAKSLNIKVINVLTGFKYISEQLKHFKNNTSQLVLAFEESHGYLIENFSRDKDAIQTATLLIKYKEQLTQANKTFKDVLNEIYQEFGYFKDKTLSPTFDGTKGRNKIKEIMNTLKNVETIELNNLTPLSIENYISKQSRNIKTGDIQAIQLPKTDLIKFIFEEGFIAVRPSGTEPKMKLYFSLNVDNLNEVIEEFKVKFNLN
ncbi:phosphoglucomutase [Staphylococcus saprophyticus]|uniref:phospho-sugar mutase n=1 Tax=Staphylococcus saprophyticus TaxID=29385 RepID=UPI000852D3A7|nr:phospho-sugar mutase [Staphylococcus saprophyticus]MDW3895976.1 phospho-sugar mutase [Staphylococcus saprophyticus]MDW3898464.1 phospho-sugar mutase [Staphylococcus saprophyticus]MDW4040890.1 phospho-sugar mutase [Staphylococcus saprophyticus]MDW4357249.1 phospho-sugar mutase [Staphylococcus saprophyticus]MEB5700766.1 phospho-sugar mutase [Staphylococcus saprophyticus]